MELIEYISNDNITIDAKQTVKEVIEVFKELNYSHLPVLSNGVLLGCIAKEDVLYEVDTEKNIQLFKHLYHFDFAIENNHFLDLIIKFSNTNANILPVIKQDNTYVGYIDLGDVLTYLAKSPFLNKDGVVLVLEKDTAEFTMSETCQIVETNGNYLLGSYIANQTNEKTQVTIRVNTMKINELIQLFRRYKYTIMNHLVDDSYLDDLKKRSEYFFKFLNI